MPTALWRLSGLLRSWKLCESMLAQNARMSRPDVSGITYKQLHNAQISVMRHGRHYRISAAVLAAIGVVIAAVGFYQVRELLAELLIFSVLFGTAGMALLILLLAQEAALKGLTRLETQVGYARAWHSGVSGQPARHHVHRSSRWN